MTDQRQVSGPVLRRRQPTLTRRASLNAVASLVDYVARIVVGFVLAPLLVTHLGSTGYGTWQVLQRLIGHATPASGRPGEALKWVVASEQSSDDIERKRRQVGNAVAVWLVFLPFVATLGGVLAWFSPSLVHAAPSDYAEVRLAAGLLVLNLVILGIAAVPQSVLQGENLGYRRLGLSTSLVAVGGVLTVVALYAGAGLVGVTLATTVTTALSGLVYLHIVRGQVSWWGIARPSVRTVRGFIGLSWWFLLWNLVMQAIKGSDVIVLGVVASAGLVTTYTLTSYVPQAVSDTVFMVISATMPGLGGLVGAGELGRAARIRGETMVLSWLVAVGAGATVIIWQPSFLALWVGSKYDAGTTATVLIVVMVLQLALIRVDSNVIDLTLRVRAKVLLGLFSAGLSALLGWALMGSGDLAIPGLVLGFILGRMVLTVAYPLLVGRLLAVPLPAQLRGLVRPGAATVVLLTLATWLRGLVEVHGWVPFALLGTVTAVAALAASYLAGLSGRQRRRVLTRAKRVVRLA